MITIIAFILSILGCLNWFCIGFFQYDFVAGIFGYQASIFSRIIYIIIGFSALWLTYAVIKYKGRLTVKQALREEKLGKKKRKRNYEDDDRDKDYAPKQTFGGGEHYTPERERI